ncbi:MAG: glycosyl transferase family 2 [Chitinophagales bacterium]|nr:MAG: glycosyl transferase family 2 [Chitinophagales bacterium]
MHTQLPFVAVVILSWNGKKYLQQFLPALLRTTYPNARFYVADNASGDGTDAFVREHFPSVHLLRLQKNNGFAGGYNLALAQIEADYYVLLNQDVEVTPGWIEPVVSLMQADSLIAAAQPKIRAFHQRSFFEYAGAAGGFLDRHGFAFCRGRFFNMVEEDHGQYDEETEIVWATGAALFIKANIFHRLGGLDADFFAHFEEIDLCWRIKNAGYKVYCCPRSVVYHVGGGSLPPTNPRKTYLNYRNNLSAIVKNTTGSQLFPVLLVRLLLDILSALKLLFTGKVQDFLAVLRAHAFFITHLHQLLGKRKEAWCVVHMHRIGVPNRKGFYRGSIIWAHFVEGKNCFSELLREKFF